jgi:hypothetical protein
MLRRLAGEESLLSAAVAAELVGVGGHGSAGDAHEVAAVNRRSLLTISAATDRNPRQRFSPV